MEKNDKESVVLIEDAGRGNLYIGSYAFKTMNLLNCLMIESQILMK